jgi:AraC-like DNA-binding protein/Tfp pilus assembly protein PilF/glutaredoxin-related protein
MRFWEIIFYVFLNLVFAFTGKAVDVKTKADSVTIFSYLMQKADLFEKTNQPDRAIANYKQIIDSRSEALSMTDIKIKLHALNNLGAIYYNQGNYSESLDILIQGIKIAETYSIEKELLAVLYMKSGNVYSVFEDFEKSITYYEKGYNYAVQLNNSELQAKILNNMTACFCYMNDVSKAKEYNSRAAKLPLNDSMLQKYIEHLNLGLINMTDGKLITAIDNYKQSIKIASEHNLSPKYLAASYSEIFKIFNEARMIDSAIFYLELYREISEKNQYANMQIDCYKNLSELYKKAGQTNKASFYQNKYIKLNDSLMNIREFNRVRNEHQNYEEGKKLQYIGKLNAIISTQKSVLIAIIAFLIILIVLLTLIYRQKKALQQAYEGLFVKNEVLIKIETKYTEALKKIQQLEAPNKTHEIAEDINEANMDADESYKNSGLTTEQKEKLRIAISQIMESPEVFCSSEFSLSIMASLIGSNTKYVSQIINETYNMNFRTYVNEFRIKESCKRLSDIDNYGNYTIKAISESVGYKSQSNFISTFRKFTGITPSFYQQMAHKEKP